MAVCSQTCQVYCFIVLDIFLSLITAQVKNLAFALAITLGQAKKLTQ